MRFQLFTDTTPPVLLTTFEKSWPFRPRLHDIVHLGLDRTPLVITRQVPSSVNDETPEPITFYAEVQNTSYQSLSLSASDDIVQRKLLKNL